MRYLLDETKLTNHLNTLCAVFETPGALTDLNFSGILPGNAVPCHCGERSLCAECFGACAKGVVRCREGRAFFLAQLYSQSVPIAQIVLGPAPRALLANEARAAAMLRASR